MKKLLAAFSILAFILICAGAPISVTAFKKDKIAVTTGDTVLRITPEQIEYVEPYGTGTRVYCSGFSYVNYLTMFDCRENIDTIYARADRKDPLLVKLRKAYPVPGTTRDTSSFILIKTILLKGGVAKTLTGYASVRSNWYVTIANVPQRWNFQESRDSVQNRIDSLEAVKKSILSVRGDSIFQRINGVTTAITPIDTP